jgi:thymidylate kinase
MGESVNVIVSDYLRGHVRVIQDYTDPCLLSSTAIRVHLRSDRNTCPEGLHPSVHQTILTQQQQQEGRDYRTMSAVQVQEIINDASRVSPYVKFDTISNAYVFGLSGGPGTGKGTLATYIQQMLPQEVVYISQGEFTRAAQAFRRFKHCDDALKANREKAKTYVEFLNWFAIACTQTVVNNVHPGTIILIDVRPPFVATFTQMFGAPNCIFYLQAPIDVMRERMRGRGRDEDVDRRIRKFEQNQITFNDGWKYLNKTDMCPVYTINTDRPLEVYARDGTDTDISVLDRINTIMQQYPISQPVAIGDGDDGLDVRDPAAVVARTFETNPIPHRFRS